MEPWYFSVAGSLLAHIGKHTPILLVENQRVPQVVIDYLDFLNPPRPVHPHTPFMHGFIFGDLPEISFPVQVELERHLIFPDPEWADKR
ncbi:hypothetical protein SY88_14320 [Clostridiales bacterium PH28_bin88]|nr:hypothetical protein SY88_14320 [Clostridiales bacterium PH28_bin88]